MSTEPSFDCLRDYSGMSLASIVRPMTRHSPRAHGGIQISALREEDSLGHMDPPDQHIPSHPSVPRPPASDVTAGIERMERIGRDRASRGRPSRPSPQANPSRDDPCPPPPPLERLRGAAPQRAVVAPDAYGGRREADGDGEDRVEASVAEGGRISCVAWAVRWEQEHSLGYQVCGSEGHGGCRAMSCVGWMVLVGSRCEKSDRSLAAA